MATDDQLRGIRAKLEVKLGGLSTRINVEADTVDLSDAAVSAVIDALSLVPGARSIAADMVSGAMFQGLGDTFDTVADQVDSGGGWDYTAVMDGGTCEECEAWDGTHFDTWEEIAGSGPLPDGGPNPDCLGSDRCRCRATIA